MSINKEDIVAIKNLKGSHFFVENYQRGYKWGIQQVQELLKDIYEFDRKGIESFYCLQPIVIKRLQNKSDNSYELIDGQQRLTTIFIVLKCIDEKIYEITYRTRDNSAEFLKGIENISVISNLDINSDIETEINPKLFGEWNEFIQSNEELNNVDNFHFYCAYQFIKNWINSIGDQIREFKETLLNYTKIIWYEQVSGDKAEDIFMKFNQGKIELAQAELIKALFVLQLNEERNIELRSFQLNQFAEEWNNIENQLQDDSFWFFVSNDLTDRKKSNRIDLLFDLLAEKPKKSNNKLYSYHKYLDQYSKRKKDRNEPKLAWFEVNDLFQQLYEWYHDRELYHLIGFIIYERLQSISEINNDYKSIPNKKEFKNKLKRTLNEYLFGEKTKKRFDIETIEYGSRNKEIQSILVLHNVINYLLTDNYYRFPFDRLKLEQGWSLEHIHAQNTEQFEKIDDIRNWLKDIKDLAENFKQDEKLTDNNVEELFDLIEKINNKLQEDNIKENNRELKNLVKHLDEKAISYFNRDSLNNLCLLDRKTNSSIGNNFFATKRADILEIDRMSLEEYNLKYKKYEKVKPFIPLATKHVFLKYYTKNENIQTTFWGASDRRGYLENIRSCIKRFLKVT